MKIIFRDRLDREFSLEAEPGEKISEFLRRKLIPIDSVITRRNGNVVSERSSRFSIEDDYTIDMVRAYHLADFVSGLNSTESLGGPDLHAEAYYDKQALWFYADGSSEYRTDQFTSESYSSLIETNFAQGFSYSVSQPEEPLALALSGGRDSLALLYLLSRTRTRTGVGPLTSITVQTIAVDHDVQIAIEACEGLEIDQSIVHSDELAEYFSLNVSVEAALQRILQTYGQDSAIAACHMFMRTGVERRARELGIKQVGFGLHNEDLLASLIRSLVSGISFGTSMYHKRWGKFDYVYPLWSISKKELTLYLECVAPPFHSSQGSPSLFDRGGHGRDIQYFVGDSIQTIWPGFSLHAFSGYERMMKSFIDLRKYEECSVCGGTYAAIEDYEMNGTCQLCKFTEQLGCR
ncbi:hypothetical protein JMX53_07320 [Cutibacterium avidum]|uniref:ATP-binding protein n=1 Tax=Cutibacterium avidum TaxID=33010 RepID=UPI00192BC9E0|nr:ATP-binding protein [Cutibacterium avidum]QQY14165.1 hypothetical protein JMX53_07320 [Cutibacterium avidum]